MTTTAGSRALVRTASGLHLRHNPTDRGGDAGIVHRVLRVGVCGTDLQIQRRVREDRAAVLGHEGIAVRLAGAGRECEIFNPVDPRDQDVILGHSYDGILQDVITGVPARCRVPARGDLPVDLGPLVEPSATAVYAWELMHPHLPPGASVAIFGGGSAALLMAMLGEDLGHRIRLIHPRRERREFLTGLGVLGAAEVTDSAPRDTADAAVICLPREAAHHAIAQATTALTSDGILDLFGGIPSGAPYPAIPHLELAAIRRSNACGQSHGPTHVDAITDSGKRLRITGHRGTSAAHLHTAQQHLTDEPGRYGKLVTQVISLHEAALWIPAMARRDRLLGEQVKVVVDLLMPHRTRTVDLDTTVSDHLQGR